MAIPKEPRQMMINMMYLVLTALLALNVSAEILNAFKLVNKGIISAKDAIHTKNDLTYKLIEKQKEVNPAKAQMAWQNAQQAKAISKALTDEIEKYKERLTKESGGIDPKTGELENDKDMEAGVRIFIEEGEGKNGKDLQNKINETRKKLIALAPPAKRGFLDKQMSLTAQDYKDPDKTEEENKWYYKNFHMVPVVASITILNGIQQSVKTAEANVIDALLASIGETDFKFDTLVARIVAPNSVITVGQTYKSYIFLSAFNSKDNPDITVGGSPVKVDGGQGEYTTVGSGEGVRKYEALIRVKDPSGRVKEYRAPGEYQVIKPFASISPDKMNVFYIGVPNPVTISAAGFTVDKLRVGISQGSITGSQGKFIVNQTAPGKAMVNVSAELPDKSVKNVGGMEFRVKRIPNPIPKIAGKNGGGIASNVFKVQVAMLADLENFDFEAKYNITHFEGLYIPKRQDAVPFTNNGATFEAKMNEVKARAKPGDVYYFENIKAKGPDGTTRDLGTLSFKIQ